MDVFMSSLLSAVIAGGVSAMGSVIALKADIRWIVKRGDEHHTRITTLENARASSATEKK